MKLFGFVVFQLLGLGDDVRDLGLGLGVVVGPLDLRVYVDRGRAPLENVLGRNGQLGDRLGRLDAVLDLLLGRAGNRPVLEALRGPLSYLPSQKLQGLRAYLSQVILGGV